MEIFGSSEVNEKFLCSVCHLVLRQAVQRFCGHRYCNDCVDHATCPACEREGNVEEEQQDVTVPQVYFTLCASRIALFKHKVWSR